MLLRGYSAIPSFRLRCDRDASTGSADQSGRRTGQSVVASNRPSRQYADCPYICPQSSAKEVYTLVNAEKIARHLSDNSSGEDDAKVAQKEIELATQLMRRHKAALEFGQSTFLLLLCSRFTKLNMSPSFRPQARTWSRPSCSPPTTLRSSLPTPSHTHGTSPVRLLPLLRPPFFVTPPFLPSTMVCRGPEPLVPRDRFPRARSTVLRPEPLLPSPAHQDVPSSRSVVPT